MPFPIGTVGNISILAHVRTQAAIFFYLNGQSRFDRLLYITVCAKKQKRPEQRRYDDTCIAPAFLVAWCAPVVSQQQLCRAASAPLRCRLPGHQRVQVGNIGVSTFLALDGDRHFSPTIRKGFSPATPRAAEMVGHLPFLVRHEKGSFPK